ncbi:RDD family protein [Streptomyces sp. NPDC059913]|uniref:RDD family protein n=1 Tax=unclassified Streptomyces TaxID=2593676 RepID=UPI00366869B3
MESTLSFGDPHTPYDPQNSPAQPGYQAPAPQNMPGHAPYGYTPYGYPPHGAYPQGGYGVGVPPLAHWGRRVGAYLLDGLIILGPMYGMGFIDLARSDDPATAEPGAFFAVGVVYTLVMAIFQLYREGSTGQTTGKRVLGISLRREADGGTLGMGMAFVRKLAHIVDSLPCYIGWFLPLFDSKRQTLADKMCRTVVVKVSHT